MAATRFTETGPIASTQQVRQRQHTPKQRSCIYCGITLPASLHVVIVVGRLGQIADSSSETRQERRQKLAARVLCAAWIYRRPEGKVLPLCLPKRIAMSKLGVRRARYITVACPHVENSVEIRV